MFLETFIDGVTVLSENEICQAPKAIVVAYITASCIIVILTAILTKEDSLAIFITPICVLMSFAIVHAKREPTGQYEYKVTIDNTVSMIEFYEKYEIVGQEGKIYTIRFME